MKIAMIGTGYVGLVSGACFAEMGNNVICIDNDIEKIEKLNNCHIPIYEPGLQSMIGHNVKAKRLFFTSDPGEAISQADIIFICVGTPPGKNGTADLSYVRETALTIGQNIENFTIVVTKSTVPVGTTAEVKAIIQGELTKRNSNSSFEMVNNPEFLKEGTAIADFMGPDRIVVGTNSDNARKIMHSLYSPFIRTDDRIVFMSIQSSELTKYASNSMLAVRISFMNEVALLAEKIGADIEEIRQGMARDKRIGKYFLYAGAGFGGSCFPKDIAALIHTAQLSDCEMEIVKAAKEANRKQKRLMAEKVLKFFNNDIKDKKIAVWGISFKAGTDDIREAPSIEVIQILREAGAKLSVHDPEALENAKNTLGKDSIVYCTDSYETLEDAEAIILMTEWKEYRTPDWEKVKTLTAGHVVFDGRNLYDKEEMKKLGFRHFGVGYGERL